MKRIIGSLVLALIGYECYQIHFYGIAVFAFISAILMFWEF